MQALLRARKFQAKLALNQPGDRFEQEADRMAEQVLRMPARATGTTPQVQRACAKCGGGVHRKESAASGPSAADARLARTAGRPLPEALRGFFEPRFGRDFGQVRLHTGSDADQSARSLNALAFTAGHDIVFADGRYAPDTASGRRLMAHELAHVVQHEDAGEWNTVRRSCRDDVPVTPGCAPVPDLTPPVRRYLFDVNCDSFAAGQEAALALFAGTIPSTATVRIVGLASADGAADLNARLCCSRARKGLEVLRRAAPAGVAISVEASVGGPGTAHDPNMRAVGIEVSMPAAPPTPTPTPVKPGLGTACPRECEFDFNDCLRSARGPMSPLQCLAQRSFCLRSCEGSRTPFPRFPFAVCARRLQPPVEITGCNHAYVETPTRRYAIITPCTDRLTFADPVNGGVAMKTDRSPDPCDRRPDCVECVPKPGVTNLESCFESQFRAYAGPSLHMLFGPNSNTFAGTLARACCARMVPAPAALGCVPGWDDPPAPGRSADCPPGPPVC